MTADNEINKNENDLSFETQKEQLKVSFQDLFNGLFSTIKISSDKFLKYKEKFEKELDQFLNNIFSINIDKIYNNENDEGDNLSKLINNFSNFIYNLYLETLNNISKGEKK